MTPTPAGLAAITPSYMTPEQIADLIDRARVAMTGARIHSTSRSSCAVRYSRLTGCTLSQAARTFGLARESLHGLWHRLYPGVPGSAGKRGRK